MKGCRDIGRGFPLLLRFVFTLALVGCSDPPPRPHVVIFLADDLGWADVGFHGSAIPTPRIDSLASTGAVLEQFYVQSMCVPTRAALLTGRYPMRYGLQRMGRELSLAEHTLAEALHDLGYRTALVGKWDLGFDLPEQRPTARGFDHQYGPYHASIDYFAHTHRGGLDWHRDDLPLREAGYATTLLGGEAVRLIAEHDPTRPLFLLLAFNAPHAPLAAPEHCSDRARSLQGLEPGRDLYAAMVICLDDEVGRVVDALDAKGIRNDTLILFASDNGAEPAWGGRNDPLRGNKLGFHEGGVRSVALANWPGVIEAGSEVGGLMHVTDLYPTLMGLAGGAVEPSLEIDGLDVWPVIAARAPSPRTEILIGIESNRAAIRVGRWKLFVKANPRGDTSSAELFDVLADPGETQNRAASEREIVEELMARIRHYGSQAAPPLPRPAYMRRDPPAVWGASAP